MPRRVCLGVGATGCPTQALAPPGRTRCVRCEATTNRNRYAARGPRPQYQGDWPRVARAAIAAYRAQHGDVCPGWNSEPHPVAPDQWVCDHDAGPMCRGCNSRKAATHDRQRAKQRRTSDAS